MKAAGLISLSSVADDEPSSFFLVECHTENEEEWGGYPQHDPFAGFRTFRKDTYALVSDERKEIG